MTRYLKSRESRLVIEWLTKQLSWRPLEQLLQRVVVGGSRVGGLGEVESNGGEGGGG